MPKNPLENATTQELLEELHTRFGYEDTPMEAAWLRGTFGDALARLPEDVKGATGKALAKADADRQQQRQEEQERKQALVEEEEA